MNKLWIVVFLTGAMIILSGCDSFIDMKTVEELIGPIQMEKDECREAFKEEVEILKIKAPSKMTIGLATTKSFEDINEAKEYVELWDAPSLKTADGAKADLTKNYEGKITVGVIKVDKLAEAYTYPAVCVDGEILSNSKKKLDKIV